MLKLTIIEPDAAPRPVHVDGDEATIGRVEGNDVVLASTGVSKRHARIVVRPDDVVVMDLKSTNGTFVDGTRINGTQPVKRGSEVKVGDFVIRIDESRYGVDRRATPAPPPTDDGIQSLAADPRAGLTPASAEPVIAFVDDPVPPAIAQDAPTPAAPSPVHATAQGHPAARPLRTSGAPPIPPASRRNTTGSPVAADASRLAWLADLMAASQCHELRVRAGRVTAARAGSDVTLDPAGDPTAQMPATIHTLRAFLGEPGATRGQWTAPDGTTFTFVAEGRADDAVLVVRSPEPSSPSLQRLRAEGALPGVACAWLEAAVAAGAGVLVASPDLRDASVVARAIAAARSDAFAVRTGIAGDERFVHVGATAHAISLGADVVVLDPLPANGDTSWMSSPVHRAPALVATVARRSVATAVAATTAGIAASMGVDAETARSMFGARFDLIVVARRTRTGSLFVQHLADVETNGIDDITVRPILLGRVADTGTAEFFSLTPAPALAELIHDAAAAGVPIDDAVSADALLEASDGWTPVAD